MKTSLLAVLGNDRPGIISGVTGILYQTRCNLEDVSMTVLEGEFAMMVVVSDLPKKRARLDEMLNRFCAPRKLSFFWKDLNAAEKFRSKAAVNKNLFVISAIGRDRTGIVYHISRELSAEKLNIQDLNSKILNSHPRKPVYAMVLEVAVPKSYDPLKLQRRLKKIACKLKVELTMKPLEQLEL